MSGCTVYDTRRYLSTLRLPVGQDVERSSRGTHPPTGRSKTVVQAVEGSRTSPDDTTFIRSYFDTRGVTVRVEGSV